MVNRKKQTVVLWGILLAALLSALWVGAAATWTVQAEDSLYLTEIQDRWGDYRVLEDRIGVDTAHSGDPIVIGEKSYERGVGMHCMPEDPTYLEINLSGLSYSSFCAEVGMMAQGSAFLDWASASFSVLVDGEERAATEVLYYRDSAVFLAVDITGAKTLRLQMSNAGSHSCDWCVWGDARLSVKSAAELLREYEASVTPSPIPTAAPTQDPGLKDQNKAYISDLVWEKWNAYGEDGISRDTNLSDEDFYLYDQYYEKGICIHAAPGGGFVEINIAGLGFQTFAAYVGIPESMAHDLSMGSVQFVVYADGQEVKRSGTKKLDDQEAEVLVVDIKDVSVLKLLVDPLEDGIAGDWGGWANALLSKSSDLEEVLATPVPTPTPIRTERPTPTKKLTVSPPSTPDSGTPSSGWTGIVLIGGIIAAGAAAAAAIIVIVKRRKGGQQK